MTELSFLIDLLLNHKLSKATRETIANRIREVEAQRTPATATTAPRLPPTSVEVPSIPEHIAQTPAAAAALASRQAAIAEAISGKMPKGQERPRKF